MQSYLVEEVVADYAEAHLTRREALRRLGLLGIGALGASALLAACGGDDGASSNGASSPRRTAASTSTTAPGTIPPPAAVVRFGGPNGELQGAWAPAERPKGSVLVIHENRGLTDHIRTIPPRFAADGFSALAIDLLSEEGGTAALGGDAQAIGRARAGPDGATDRRPARGHRRARASRGRTEGRASSDSASAAA